MIKPLKKKSNKDKITMKELQIPARALEYEKCVKDPCYFYNTYVRKEGQPILTEEQYSGLVKEWEEAKHSTTKN